MKGSVFMSDFNELINEAVESNNGPAVFKSRLLLCPATGWEHPVLRAAVYADSSEQSSPGPAVSKIEQNGKQIRVAIVESVEARAHDLTSALRKALEEANAGVPVLELYRNFDGQQYKDLIADSWEVPHRVADPYWREACIPEHGKNEDQWKSFFETDIGQKLDPSKPIDLADLLRWYPTALLFGFDPRAAILSAKNKKNANKKTANEDGANEDAANEDAANENVARRSIKPLGRLCRSEIVAEIGGYYKRTKSLQRPLPAMSDTKIYQTLDGNWTLSEDEAKKENGKPVLYPDSKKQNSGRPSIIGLDDVTPSVREVPDIYAQKVILTSYVSFAGIRNLQFSSFNEEQVKAARRLLMAMGVASILGAEKDLHIRSDCELVLDDDPKAIVREVAYTNLPHQDLDKENFEYEKALELLSDAASAASEVGVWDSSPNPIKLVARSDLRKLLGPPPGSEGEQ